MKTARWGGAVAVLCIAELVVPLFVGSAGLVAVLRLSSAGVAVAALVVLASVGVAHRVRSKPAMRHARGRTGASATPLVETLPAE